MAIKIREVDDISILDVDGKIDINSSDIIETVGWLTSSGKINIIVNMENVDLVDYSGLSILAIAFKNVVNHKGKMKLLSVGLPVMELMKVVKLDSVFEIYQDEESAINSFYKDDAVHPHLRRRFQRLDMHLGVKYSLVSEQKKPKVFEGSVLNMSGAGIYIYTPHTFPITSPLDLEFVLPDTHLDLHSNGRVIWLADKEIQPHSFPGMGVSFVHLTPEKERQILDFIDKNITHRAEPS